MKQIPFTVNITFSEKIQSDEEIAEITKNIAEAIRSHVETAGLAPEDSDAFTEKIEVMPQHLPEATVVINL